MKALIDGDVLLYRCGFAAQKTEYYAEERATGSLLDTYSSKVDAIAAIKAAGGTKKTVALRKRVVPEPFSFAAHTVKVQIRSICQAIEVDEYCLYLSPNDRNIFRYEIAKTLPYKGNRTAPKPLHYKKLREYMIDKHPTKCVPCLEADDAMGIDQDKEGHQTMICSIDKDMLQVPGLHYNFVTGEVTEVTTMGSLALMPGGKKLVGSGICWFYAQMLLGDRCDNIQGINGYGPVNTYRALHAAKTEKQLQEIVQAIYLDSLKDPTIVAERFRENANLLWILQNPIETFDRRGLINETK